MANAIPLTHLLLLLSLSISVSVTVTIASTTTTSTDFIRSSCRATQYPSLCLQCLSSYGSSINRSPRALARAALTVSAERARAASAFVGQICGPKSGWAGGPVRDCLENMADSVDRLKEAAQEMGRLGRAGSASYRWHRSNVQTWCSAALTDENTCLDGLSRGVDPPMRAAIRKKVVEVAQVTSNALALVNKVGSG